MLDEPDIWRATNLLLKNQGDNAPLVAAQRADEMLARGDMEGQAVWKRILKAAEALMRVKCRDSDGIN